VAEDRGSKADLTARKSDFRFTPESGLRADMARHVRFVPQPDSCAAKDIREKWGADAIYFSWYRGDSKTCRRKLLPDWNRNFTVCSTPWSFQSVAKDRRRRKEKPGGIFFE
jgi:hypothetical protein